MEFECPKSKCGKVFRPHPFIAMKHPSQAKCPVCGTRGKITEQGTKVRNSRFEAINKANFQAANKPQEPKDEI